MINVHHVAGFLGYPTYLVDTCNWIACKRRSSVKSRACLRRFDDVTGVEKVALQTQKKEKK